VILVLRAEKPRLRVLLEKAHKLYIWRRKSYFLIFRCPSMKGVIDKWQKNEQLSCMVQAFIILFAI
jgi:hypothetical protein